MVGAEGGAATLTPARSGNAQSGAAGTVTAWTPSSKMDVVAWVRVGARLGAMTRCSQWLLGDWIRYGTSRWGEKYSEAARITGYDIQSLRNIAYVAGAIEPYRRRDNLTWSHHAEVCALETEEQDRWLDVAEAQRMSVADLRMELRGSRQGKDSESAKESTKIVTCPECAHKFEAPRA